VGPVIVTFTPGTTAPVASVTVPTIPPVEIVVWANAAVAHSEMARTSNASVATAREEIRFSIFDRPFGMFTESV
jgi:hypothetical protein